MKHANGRISVMVSEGFGGIRLMREGFGGFVAPEGFGGVKLTEEGFGGI